MYTLYIIYYLNLNLLYPTNMNINKNNLLAILLIDGNKYY